jgi:hypothetical protein
MDTSDRSDGPGNKGDAEKVNRPQPNTDAAAPAGQDHGRRRVGASGGGRYGAEPADDERDPKDQR